MAASIEAPLAPLLEPVEVFEHDPTESPDVELRLVPKVLDSVGLIL